MGEGERRKAKGGRRKAKGGRRKSGNWRTGGGCEGGQDVGGDDEALAVGEPLGIRDREGELEDFFGFAAVGAAIALNPAARWPLFLLPLCLFVRMALNAIDGMLAREHGQKSRLGAVLNEIGDVAADTRTPQKPKLP